MARSKEKPPLFTDEELGRVMSLAGIGLTPAEIGGVIGRPARSVSAGAKENELQFSSKKITTIRSFGRKKGVFLREDHGGSVGVRWGAAHRSRASFNRDDCELLLDLGFLSLAEKAGQNAYLWSPPVAPKKEPKAA